MKINLSRKLLITSLAIVFLSIFSGLVVNLLTSDNNFNEWLKAKNIGTRELIFGVILTGIALIICAYLQFRYTQKSQQTTDKEVLTENIEPDVERLFDSLKERYQNRYQSKLDGHFEITLEVSEDFDSPPRSITEQFEGNATKGEAIKVIRQAFEQKGRLLIAGNPGVGKTVLLLKLAIDLLDKIKDLEKEPFPVIFNLASWSEEYENFGDWLKAMLVSGYGFSRDFAETVLRQEKIIFLLDGLDELARNETDEIAAEKRAECLASLNDYLSGGRKAVICSRIEEFLAMKKQQKQDAPVSAKVRVLNLTPRQVLKALKRAKDDKKLEHHAAATNLLKMFENGENNTLLEVLRTPFYFTTTMEVFDQQILSEKVLPKMEKEIKTYLIEIFVKRKLASEANPNNFNKEKTKKWLIELAKLMERKQLVSFELADLQPGDLFRQWLYKFIWFLLTFLFHAIFLMLIFESLHFFYQSGLSTFPHRVGPIAVSIIISIVFALLIAELMVIFSSNEIITKEIVRWNFNKINVSKAILSILFGSLGISISMIFFYWIDLMISSEPPLGDWYGTGLFGLFFGFCGGLFMGIRILRETKRFSYLNSAYQRLRINVNISSPSVIAYLIILPTMLICNLFSEGSIAQLLKESLIPFLLILPLISSISFFSSPFFKHCVLRICFYIEGSVPLKYETFLNYAAADQAISKKNNKQIGLRFLEKDGGHWRFRHQNLQEYFANQIDC